MTPSARIHTGRMQIFFGGSAAFGTRGQHAVDFPPYLSQPIFSLGITPSAQNHLSAHGIQYVGDLIRLDELYLLEIWGVGPATVEKIQTKLKENGVCFGMDVIRVDNRWYRRKTN